MISELLTENLSKMRRDLKVFTRGVGRKAQELVRENWFRPIFALWKRNVHLPTLLSTTSKKDNLTPNRGIISHGRGYLVDEQFRCSLQGVTTTEKKRRALS